MSGDDKVTMKPVEDEHDVSSPGDDTPADTSGMQNDETEPSLDTSGEDETNTSSAEEAADADAPEEDEIAEVAEEPESELEEGSEEARDVEVPEEDEIAEVAEETEAEEGSEEATADDADAPGEEEGDEFALEILGPGLSKTDDAERMMEEATILTRLESLVFVSPEPISVRRLARILSLQGKRVRELLGQLEEQYRDRGVILQEVSGGFQFRSHPDNAGIIRHVFKLKPLRISRAALETLAIVAYRQPITRAEAENVRGVDCGGVLKFLFEKDLVRVIGRKEEPGRPIIYGTTQAFLELFGLKALSDLPALHEFSELWDEHREIVDLEAPLDESEEGELDGGGDTGEVNPPIQAVPDDDTPDSDTTDSGDNVSPDSGDRELEEEPFDGELPEDEEPEDEDSEDEELDDEEPEDEDSEDEDEEPEDETPDVDQTSVQPEDELVNQDTDLEQEDDKND